MVGLTALRDGTQNGATSRIRIAQPNRDVGTVGKVGTVVVGTQIRAFKIQIRDVLYLGSVRLSIRAVRTYYGPLRT